LSILVFYHIAKYDIESNTLSVCSRENMHGFLPFTASKKHGKVIKILLASCHHVKLFSTQRKFRLVKKFLNCDKCTV